MAATLVPARRTIPSPAAQQEAAQRIVDAMPERRLTIGEGLAILAIALDAVGALDHGGADR